MELFECTLLWCHFVGSRGQEGLCCTLDHLSPGKPRLKFEAHMNLWIRSDAYQEGLKRTRNHAFSGHIVASSCSRRDVFDEGLVSLESVDQNGCEHRWLIDIVRAR